MEKKNQKFQELVKKMETLKETEKGILKGGFSVFSVNSSVSKLDSNSNEAEYCSCTGTGSNTNNFTHCTCNDTLNPSN